MRRNPRQDAINRLREQQDRRSQFGTPLFEDRFDRHFDRMESNLDKAFDHPGRTFLKVGLIAIVLNLLFWGAIIAGIFFGLNYFGVI